MNRTSFYEHILTQAIVAREGTIVWEEAERFRVVDAGGTFQIVVKMTSSMTTSPLLGPQRVSPSASFHFLLNGANVSALPDGTFRDDTTGDILRRV